MKNKFVLICLLAVAITIRLALVPSSATCSDNNFHCEPQQLFPYSVMPEVMPGTKQLTLEGDISVIMMDGAHKFIELKIDESIGNRSKLWNSNLSSREAYELSVEPNRRRLMKYIGVEDKSEP